MFVTTFLSVILTALIGFIVMRLRRHYSHWSHLGIAHEQPHWIYGNHRDVMVTKTFHDSMAELYEKFKNSGPFAGYYWFTKSAVFVVDPELIKHVLIKDFSKFTDRGMFHNEEDDPFSGNLFNLDGVKWRHMRSKISPGFTSVKMKTMFPLVTQVAWRCVDVFNADLKESHVLDVSDLLSRYTTDVIGTSAFGLDMSSLEDPTSIFSKMSRKALVQLRYGLKGFAFRFNFPKLARWLRMKETLPDVEKYFMDLVGGTVDYREKNHVRRNDFMDMLIGLKNNKLMKTEGGEQLPNITFGEMAAQAFVFLTAGFETSATTMALILYELARNEEIQDTARLEVLEVLENHNQEFSYECMKEMAYLEQVIFETLRLHTIAPILNRQALEDYVVPGHPKYVISKGMTVIIPAAAIHRDERYYPNPLQFNPDNFSPKAIANRESYLYLSFGAGPRYCVGMRFAKMQILIIIALLLKSFKYSTCDQTTIPIKYDMNSFIMIPEKGIYLKVEKFK